jgi:hypothetical protein
MDKDPVQTIADSAPDPARQPDLTTDAACRPRRPRAAFIPRSQLRPAGNPEKTAEKCRLLLLNWSKIDQPVFYI